MQAELGPRRAPQTRCVSLPAAGSTQSGLMFTVEDRRRVRESLLEKARQDGRVVAGAEIGATARGGGDRWSDLDLTFGVADHASTAEVLVDWTSDLAATFAAVHLFDVTFMSSVYRVFLLPGNLQVDLSFTPRAQFGALGPKFTLLFGSAVERKFPGPPSAAHIFCDVRAPRGACAHLHREGPWVAGG